MLLCSNDFQNDLRRHYSEAWLQVLVYCYLASQKNQILNMFTAAIYEYLKSK